MIHTPLGDVNLAVLIAGAIVNAIIGIVKLWWERGRK